jgi:TolB-like protein
LIFDSRPSAASSQPTAAPRLIHFGAFTVDLHAHELYKHSRKIKLQEKPFRVLEILLERPGELVTRAELTKTLWSPDTFVDFDHNLKTAVRRVRAALGDSAESPRFVETLGSRGYRFIAPVQRLNRFSRAAGSGLARKIRLAVLPFTYPPRDADLDEFFSDGMTDATISELGCLRPSQLGVIARTSVMRYKRTEKTIGQIGQELDVDYIFEGGIRRHGSLVRVSVRMIQVSDETLVWAGIFDQDLSNNAVAVQHSTAESVARSPEIAALFAAQVAEEIDSAPLPFLRNESLQQPQPSRGSSLPQSAD